MPGPAKRYPERCTVLLESGTRARLKAVLAPDENFTIFGRDAIEDRLRFREGLPGVDWTAPISPEQMERLRRTAGVGT